MLPAMNAMRLLAAACLVLALVLPARAGSYGSDALLHGLWTEAQLAGTPADHVVTRPWSKDPDLTPPARLEPLHPLPPVPDRLQGVIRRVDPAKGERLVALTFDLCERASNVSGYRNEIVNFLRGRRIPATFFAGGKWMRSHPEKAMQLMADPLFELGNHSWTHANMAIIDDAEAGRQVLWTQAQYELLREELARRAEAGGLAREMAAVPESLRLFRLPYGRNAAHTLDLLAGMGLPVIQWDALGEWNDGTGTPAQSVTHAMQHVRPGSIILLHANAVPKNTQLVVPLLVEALEKQGFRFVTVSDLLQAGPVATVQDGYFEKPGDNVQYDTLFLGGGTLHPRPAEPKNP
jgi:peptidoglycan/xylan/chitin deacetylase (PgdA/CDA1 family)